MGNKTTRSQREHLELYENDKQKKDLEIIITKDVDFYDQMSKLARFLHLERLTLTISNLNLLDFTPIKDGLQCLDIMELYVNLSNTPIADINIFPEFIFLKRFRLDINNTNIDDINDLSKIIINNLDLQYLYLDLSNTQVTSLKSLDLSKLTSLKYLIIKATHLKISSIDSFIQNCSKLTELEELRLDFSNTQISEIYILGVLLKQTTKLLQLDLRFDQTEVTEVIEVLAGITHTKDLRELTLSFSETQIKEFDQFGFALTSIQSNLTYLKLCLQNTQIECLDNTFSKLGYLTLLQSLSINLKNTNISIKTLKRSLDVLNNINYLKLSLSDQIDNELLQVLGSLDTLKTLILDLNNSKIESLDGLTNQFPKNIRHLHILMNSTLIEKLNLANLSMMPSLRTLQIDLSNTNIKNIIGIKEQLPNLTTLRYLEIDITNTKYKIDQQKLEESFKKNKFNEFYILQDQQ